MRHLKVIFLLLLAKAALAEAAFPAEIGEYIERREVCEHFRQEPWPEGSTDEEKERREFIVRQLKHYCTGADQALQELKRKYKNDSVVTDRLEKYEFPIEGRP